MIKVRVKTKWRKKAGAAEQVSIHEKHLKQAQDLRTGLEISCEDGVMVVDYEHLVFMHPRKEYFKDKFKGEIYRLVDFYWKPDHSPKQLTLL